MKKNKSLDYSDQWNIQQRDASSLQQMKACLLYEFARESETLLAWVDQHRNSPLSPDDFGALAFSYLQNISVPLARLVAAMGRKASLSRPWYELKSSFRYKLASAAYPALRYAEKVEVLKSFEKRPAWKSYRQFRDLHPVEPSELNLRVLNLVVDVSCPTSELVRQFELFARKKIALQLGGNRGRGASGAESLKKQLKNLGLLRLLSRRNLTQARLAVQASSSTLLAHNAGGEGGINNRIRGAHATFRQLFPGLFVGEQPEMISYVAYKKTHPGGRPSVGPKSGQRSNSPTRKPTNKSGAVLRKFKRLVANRAK